MRISHPLVPAIAAVCVAASPYAAIAQNASGIQPGAPSLTVKAIDVQFVGPAAVSKERVLANMKTAVGKQYTDAAVEEDIRSLYAMGNIANVRIFGEPLPDGVKVVVVIQSRVTVKEIRFEGATKIKPSALKKKLVTKAGDQLSESNLETDRQKILEEYQDKGYKDTQVKFVTENDPATGKAVVTFQITEAGKTVVHRIKFEGNQVFKAGQLKKVIKTQTHNILSFITKAGRLQEDQLDADVQALREFYQNHGYLDVKIGDPLIQRVDGKPEVTLTFPITEGEQYHVGKVSFSGNQVFTDAEINGAIQMRTGGIYSPKGVTDDVKAIQDLYGSRGYIDAQVVPETTSGGHNVNNITYRLSEGSQSYIERINIQGNTRTKDKVIRRELAVAPGDVYNTVRIDASKQRLQNLNYFERVETFPSDTDLAGRKNLNVQVQEKRTGSLNFGAGFSSIDSLLGFIELTQSNFDITNWPHFTGGGERFRIRAQAGTQRKDFTVSLTEPYFLDYQLQVGGEAYYRDADYLSTYYNQKNYGFDIFTRKALNQWVSARLEYRLEDIDIYAVDQSLRPKDALNFLNSQSGNNLKSQLAGSLVYDSRDSVFLTRKGTRVEFSSFVAGNFLGGDVKDYGFNLEGAHYILLPGDTILTFNGEVGVVDNWGGGSDVPIFDRLYLGGANSLRGFKYRDVGPRIGGLVVGGNTLARATVEYTFPVIERVRGAVFCDTGFVNSASYSFGTGQLNSDAGLGLRLDLPIGPVRLDYGIPFQNNGPGSSSGRFNFNIGYQF